MKLCNINFLDKSMLYFKAQAFFTWHITNLIHYPRTSIHIPKDSKSTKIVYPRLLNPWLDRVSQYRIQLDAEKLIFRLETYRNRDVGIHCCGIHLEINTALSRPPEHPRPLFRGLDRHGTPTYIITFVDDKKTGETIHVWGGCVPEMCTPQIQVSCSG